MDYLKNSQLQLRALEPEDLEVIYKWENDASIWSVSSTLAPYSRYQLKKYIAESACHDLFESKQLRLIIVKRRSGLRVGMVDLFDFDPFNSRAAIGLLVNSAHRRKGIATSAMMLLMDYAFHFLKLHQIYAHIAEDNAPCVQMFRSLGFIQNGTLQQWISDGSHRYRDVLVFQMINPDDDRSK